MTDRTATEDDIHRGRRRCRVSPGRSGPGRMSPVAARAPGAPGSPAPPGARHDPEGPDQPPCLVERAWPGDVEEREERPRQGHPHGIACGTGERVAVLDLARSVRGALAALEVSAARGRPVASAELATLDALLDRLPEAGLRPFLDQLIAPLTEHDLRTGSDLVASLRAFVGSGGAMVPTARSLFLHPNTLRHRMRRVTDLTGRDPLDWRDRICFTVALGAQDRRCAPRER